MNQRTQVRGLHPNKPGKGFLADSPFFQLPSQDIARMYGRSRRDIVYPMPSLISLRHNITVHIYVHLSAQFMDKYTD